MVYNLLITDGGTAKMKNGQPLSDRIVASDYFIFLSMGYEEIAVSNSGTA